jgi:hypothetical protein
VLIVDEASTIGDRDLLAICRLVDDAGATLRLIGDTAQHGSVPAGGTFNHLVALDPDGTPQLVEARRLRNPGERDRADLVRSGQINRALAELEAAGQLILTDSPADTFAAMVDRWYQHRQNGDGHPMVHGRNRQRQMLNHLAQNLLAADGHVDLERSVVVSGDRRLAVGDEVIARHGDRRVHPRDNAQAWMRNGTTGRVVAVHHGDTPAGDTISIQTADGVIDCTRAVFDRRRGGIDLGYAVTSYAVQGSTRSASTSAISATTSRSELYVDITRGRDSNLLYATRHTNPPDNDTEQHLPRLDNELVPSLRRNLARSDRRNALASDPTALAASRTGHGHTLPSLLAAQRRTPRPPVDQAVIRASNALRRQARSEPPPSMRRTLPERPSSPHLAGRWDQLAGDIALHLATTHDLRRRAPTTPLEHTLGPRPDNTDRASAWDQLADTIVQFAVDTTTAELNHLRQPDQPASRQSWLPDHLRTLARAGHLAEPDLDNLDRVIGEIDDYRSRHHIGADCDTPLGPRPVDASARAEHDRLSRRLAIPTTQRERSIA